MDDVALLEQMADQVIRASLGQLGIDGNRITLPERGYQPKRRLRVS